jgi:4-hydroxyphenylpyruvate dioxygenase-like putative hemolysin
MRRRQESTKPIDLGRHRQNCTICAHEKREEIEHEYVNWTGPTAIAIAFGLADRSTIYRHARALGLRAKRRRNVRAALEKIIEKAGDVEVTSAAVVAAVQAYAKINAAGQWVDRSEHLNLNELFERMTREELETYAKEGTLPTWFTEMAGATEADSPDAENVEE